MTASSRVGASASEPLPTPRGNPHPPWMSAHRVRTSSRPGEAGRAAFEERSSYDAPAVVDRRLALDVETGLDTLLVVALVSALAPFIAAMFDRIKLPQVVVLIVGGVLV